MKLKMHYEKLNAIWEDFYSEEHSVFINLFSDLKWN